MGKHFSTSMHLEPRIVFDAAMAATVDNGIEQAAEEQQAESDEASVEAVTNNSDQLQNFDFESLPPSEQVNEIVFIDSRVEDAQGAADSVGEGSLAIIIDAETNGIELMTQIIESYENLDSIHIITHGSDGKFFIGNDTVSNATLASYQEQIAGWNDNLSADADILFYGCDLAETADGQMLLNTIANLTGADVAASTDVTGSFALGGDWDLEFSTGAIETDIALSQSFITSFASTLDAAPTVDIIDLEASELIGDDFTFTLRFDNNLDTGFGPYINLFTDHTGADGVFDADTNTYTDAQDGITFNGATFLGQSLTVETITIVDADDATAGIQIDNHPFALDGSGDNITITLDADLGFTEGDQLHIIQLPFGSYTAGQPASDIVVSATISNLADLGAALNIAADPGFRFGDADALNNPSVDPVVQSTNLNSANTSNGTVTPSLFRVSNTFSGPEGETATGENFGRSYDIEVEVADGQTITNGNISVTLPEEVEFTGGSSATGGVLGTAPTQDVAGSIADDQVNFSFTELTGTETASVDFFVPEFDQSGTSIIDPNTGAAVGILNGGDGNVAQVEVTGDWIPLDSRDRSTPDPLVPLPQSDSSDLTGFTARSIATQKSVSIQTDNGVTGLTPGDVLQYNINFQVSDYFAFDQITLEDIFSDGQTFDTTFDPLLNINRLGAATNDIDISSDTTTSVASGITTVDFDLGSALSAQFAGDDNLEGGRFDGNNNSGTIGSIRFRTTVNDTFTASQAPGTDDVKEGDVLTNTNTTTGRLIDSAGNAIGPLVADATSTSITVIDGTLAVSVFSVNGSTGADLSTVQPGDDVTYRIRYDLGVGDFEDFDLSAFIPLPVFSVDDINADGVGGDSFTAVAAGSGSPSVGEFRFLSDTTSGFVIANGNPTASVDAAANSVSFNFGDLSDADNDGGVIDLLFTVRATTDPFADELLLTTLGRQEDQNSPGTVSIVDDLAQITLAQPEISGIIKGAIATNVGGGSTFTPTYSSGAPNVNFEDAGATGTGVAAFSGLTVNSTNLNSLGLDNPNLDNNLSNVDNGDLVRFAIIIENTGTSSNGAFDVAFEDNLPPGFIIPAGGINLSVTDGTGSSIPFTRVNGSDASDTDALFSGSGLILTDGATGALAQGDPTSGQNIAIITYDLQVDNVEAGQTLTSSATLTNFAGAEGALDATVTDLTDAATVNIAEASVDKTITGSSEGSTAANSDVLIGEVITYQVDINIPEGTFTNAEFIDTLGDGLAFVEITSITSLSGDITTDLVGGFTDVISNAIFSSVNNAEAQDRVTLDLGNITNNNTDNSTSETLTIEYTAVVLNETTVNDGDVIRNTANIRGSNSNETDITEVTVSEPVVEVEVFATPNLGNDAETVTWTVIVTAPSDNNGNVYDVDLTNVIPAGLTYVDGSFAFQSGIAASETVINGSPAASWDSLTNGQTATYTFQTTTDSDLNLGSGLTTTANVVWSSLSGEGTNEDIAGANATHDSERTGDINDLGENQGLSNSANILRAVDTGSLNIVSGILFEDLNLDGVVSAGERRIGDVDIILTSGGADGDISTTGDNESVTTRTNANGEYSFGVVPEGDVTISYAESGPNSLDSTEAFAVFDPTGDVDDNSIERTFTGLTVSTGNNIGVLEVNEAPTFTDFGGTRSFTPGSDPVLLDDNATINDPELSFRDDFAGTTLTIGRNGGASSSDIFTSTGLLGPITEGGPLVYNGVTVGTVTQNSGGELILDFTNSSATNDVINSILQSIAYENDFSETNTPDSIILDVELSDGNPIGNVISPPQQRQGVGGPLIGSASLVISLSPAQLPIVENPQPIAERNGPSTNNTPFETEVIPSPFRNFGSQFSERVDIFNDIGRIDLQLVGSAGQDLVLEEKPMVVSVPKTIFRHTNPSEQLTYEAKLPSGGALPEWLTFNADELTFTGTPPLGSRGQILITIIARDGDNNEVKAPFKIIITKDVEEFELYKTNSKEDAPKSNEPAEESTEDEANFIDEIAESISLSFNNGLDTDVKKASFSQQIFMASQQAELADARKLLNSLNQIN